MQPSTSTSSRAFFKAAVTGTSVYALAMIAQRLASLILTPLITKNLSPASYGVMDLLEQVSSVTSLLLGGSFSASLGYFYFAATPGSDTAEYRGKVIGTTFAGALLLGAVAGLAGWLTSGWISDVVFHSSSYRSLLWLVFGALPLGFGLEAALGWLRIENRGRLFASCSLFRIVLSVAGIIVLLQVYGLGIWGVMGANLIAAVLTAVWIFSAFLRRYPWRVDMQLFWKMARFSVPLSLSSIGIFIIHFGDRFILPYYRSFADLGVYAIAYKYGMLISMVHSAFHTYWASQIYEIVKREDARAMVSRMFTYMVLVMALCGLGILAVSRPAIYVLTAPEYHSAILLVPVILLAYLVRSVGDFFRTLFYAMGKPSYDAACNWLGAAVCLAAYFLLIPRFGTFGAAWATLITFLVVMVASLVLVYRVWPYEVEVFRLVKVVTVAGAGAAVYTFLPSASLLVEVLRGGALLLGAGAALLLWKFPTPAEWNFVRAQIARIAH